MLTWLTNIGGQVASLKRMSMRFMGCELRRQNQLWMRAEEKLVSDSSSEAKSKAESYRGQAKNFAKRMVGLRSSIWSVYEGCNEFMCICHPR